MSYEASKALILLGEYFHRLPFKFYEQVVPSILFDLNCRWDECDLHEMYNLLVLKIPFFQGSFL